MENLIKALQILQKYDNSKYPTHCEHDILYFPRVKPSSVSEEDVKTLQELGIEADFDKNIFYSYEFGSC